MSGHSNPFSRPPRSTPSPRLPQANPLSAKLEQLNRYLHPSFIKQLSLRDAQALLVEINAFHQEVQRAQSMGNSRPIIIAGCRLASDLTEAIHLRLAELVHQQDHAIEALSAQLRQRMQERLMTTHLLKRTVMARTQTQHTADEVGIGVIL